MEVVMKKTQIVISLLIFLILISSVVTFSLAISPCVNTWDAYRDIYNITGTTKGAEDVYRQGLRFTFIVVFGGIGMLSSLVALFFHAPRLFRKETWSILASDGEPNNDLKKGVAAIRFKPLIIVTVLSLVAFILLCVLTSAIYNSPEFWVIISANYFSSQSATISQWKTYSTISCVISGITLIFSSVVFFCKNRSLFLKKIYNSEKVVQRKQIKKQKEIAELEKKLDELKKDE